ncbi:ubiquitin-activating E1 FCCH domain-containing protein [Bradyrhizobium sp. WSM1417]|uniref:ubiquitin-activating E1 FCCH domain-containing protein n=1 Tax=Bradyrhizobium sp. WSM1417 TaxID=754500 RepID=UPI0012EB6E7B|nr:ubiquitin-activating E1 FCCH domain-containing protein [Bradyrhizobium sp. WSM1417]
MDRRTFLQGVSVASLTSLLPASEIAAAPAPLAAARSASSTTNKKLQVNFNFLQTGGDYPFLNHLKTAQAWSFVDSSARPTSPAPNTLDSDGYPLTLSNGGLTTVFFIPSQDPMKGRPGRYVVTWEGDGTISTPGTAVSGAKSGLNGRYEFIPSSTRVVFSITATNPANRIRNIKYFHVADEARIKAGEVFAVDFKQRLADANFGVFRFLNWQNGNFSNVTTWASRKPVSYVYYAGYELRGSIYAGITTNQGDNYSISFGSGAPNDKQTITVLFNANAATTTPTLNLNGAGAVPIRNQFGLQLDTTEKPSQRYATLVYDRSLGVWLKKGGDASGFNQGLDNGVPLEICLQLCVEMAVHPWFVTPYLAVDPATDFIAGLAAYCKAKAPVWMVPRFEVVPNECWNSVFCATQIGYLKAKIRWPTGGSYNIHNWAGMVGSIGGQAVSAVYGNDGSKYQTICGVQQSSEPSASRDRLASSAYVADGGTAASKWITHVAPACYFGASYSCAQEVAAAYKYSLADTAMRAQLATDFVNSTLVTVNSNNATGPITVKIASFTAWKTWAAGFGVKLTAYEGGWSPDYPATDSNSPISGATKGNQCVLTLATTNAPNNSASKTGTGAVPGMMLKITGVNGMVELNGNTYKVISVNGNSVTIDVNSSSFAPYTSGGTASYQGDAVNRTALRKASKSSNVLPIAWKQFYTGLAGLGTEFPSVFQFAGADNSWSVLDPDIYSSSTSQQWNAILTFGR